MTTSSTGHATYDGDELSVRLVAYAQIRLTPDALARARTRARVMAEARVMAQSRALAGTRALAGSRAADERTRERRGGRGFGWRRPLFALAAALMLVAALAGGVAASTAGGPLYGARLWLETLTLPSDPAARTAAELTRLDARLEEASDAARHGNGEAVTAALEAYRRTTDEAMAAAGPDNARQTRLELVLGRHLVVLRALAERLPAPAAAAIERTIQRSDQTIEKIDRGKPAGTPGNGNVNGNGRGDGRGNGRGNGTGGGGAPGATGTDGGNGNAKGQGNGNPSPGAGNGQGNGNGNPNAPTSHPTGQGNGKPSPGTGNGHGNPPANPGGGGEGPAGASGHAGGNGANPSPDAPPAAGGPADASDGRGHSKP